MRIYNPSKEDIIKASKLLESNNIVNKKKNYPEVFKGYISSFGASIVHCGIFATLIVFESKDTEANNRQWIPELIRQYLAKEKALSTLVKENINNETECLKLTRQIENAAVAFKLALRMYKYVDDKREIPLGENVPNGERKLPKYSGDSTNNMGYEYMYHNDNTVTEWAYDRIEPMINANDSCCTELKEKYGYSLIRMTVNAPGLLIGSGISHGASSNEATKNEDKEKEKDKDFKTGMQFDYTTGLPIIPGSSVKGVLRSYFKNFAPEGVDAGDLLTKIFVEGNDKDIFADALLTKAGKNGRVVGEDYITPHYPNLLKDPTPIKILKVLPGVEFTFCFKLSDSAGMDVSKKMECFKEILQTVGIGAKTNVGYGQLTFKKENAKDAR